MALATETAQSIDDADERADAFVRIAETQRVARDLPGARESLLRATDAVASIRHLADFQRPSRARTFIIIARAQVAMGDVASAQQTLVQALTLTDRIEVPRHRAAVLSDISDAQRLAGDEDGARDSLSLSLVATDQIESEDSKFSVLTAIAKAQASSGALHVAAVIVNKVGEIYERIGPAIDYSSDFDLADVAAAQIEAGDIEGALRTAQLIGDKEDFGRALVLADIAYELAAAGDVAAAFATDEHVRGAALRFVVVTHAGVALAEAGDIARASAAAARITEIEEEEFWSGEPAHIERAIQRSTIFEAIVDAHIAAGAFDKALGALKEIERGDHIANAAMAIAEAQMVARDLDAARAAVDTVCEFRRRIDRCVEALSALAAAHASAGNIEKARELASSAWEDTEWTWFSLERVRAFRRLVAGTNGNGRCPGRAQGVHGSVCCRKKHRHRFGSCRRASGFGGCSSTDGRARKRRAGVLPGHGNRRRNRRLFWNSKIWRCQSRPRFRKHRQGSGAGGRLARREGGILPGTNQCRSADRRTTIGAFSCFGTSPRRWPPPAKRRRFLLTTSDREQRSCVPNVTATLVHVADRMNAIDRARFVQRRGAIDDQNRELRLVTNDVYRITGR